MKKNILIVEDDAWFAEYYKRLLEAQDVTVLIAHDPHGAIECLDSQRVDGVILDLFLTEGSAFMLLHEMQSHADLATIPVVLCTSSAADLPSDLSAYGVVTVLDKTTMKPLDMISAVKRVVA